MASIWIVLKRCIAGVCVAFQGVRSVLFKKKRKEKKKESPETSQPLAKKTAFEWGGELDGTLGCT